MIYSTGSNIKVFACNSNRDLAESIAKKLGLKLGDAEVEKFSDGEISVKINETIRGADVFIIQSTSYPVNDNLMELLIMIDAMKRASAGRITAVMPYYGYARQDRKARARDPISAKLVANMPDKRWRKPCADNGPALCTDSGLLRYSRRQPGRQPSADWFL